MLNSRADGILTSLLRTVLAILLLCLAGASTGCAVFGSDDHNDPEPTPVTTPTATLSAGIQNTPVVPIRSSEDPEQLLGSAVVLDSDGLLATTSDVLESDAEALLPDGTALQPALVSLWPEYQIALLKIPARDLQHVEMSTMRPSVGDEVVATGFDGMPGTLGRVAVEISEADEGEDNADRRIRGAPQYRANGHLPDGFAGGALFDDDDQFAGIVTRGDADDESGNIVATSHWSLIAWFDEREQRLAQLRDEASDWERQTLLGEWSIRYPDGWSISIPSESDDAMRAEVTPGDPDVSLQLAISVEPNEYGTDTDEFVDEVFAGRSSARIWSIERLNGRPYVRASIVQEGALVDVAYVLDDARLIAISLTSGYQVESDHAQVDEARVLFETVVRSLERN